MKNIRIVCLVIAVMASVASAGSREWADRSGKFHINATLVVVKEEKVYLEKADRKVVAVPLERISAQDLDYLQSLPETRAYFSEHPQPQSAVSAKAKMAVIHVSDPTTTGEVRRFKDMGWGVKSLAFSPDGRFLAAGKLDRAIYVFDVDKGIKVDSHEKLQDLGEVTCLTFAPDGRKLLSGGWSGRIQTWDVSEDGRLTEAKPFVGHGNAVKSICVSSDGNTVLSGDEKKMARAWNLHTCREQFAIEGFRWQVAACFLSRSAKQGVATDGQRIDLIDMVKGEVIQSMSLAKGICHSCAITRDGRHVACCDGYAMRVWEICTGNELPSCQGEQIQWAAAFTPNGKYLLSGVSGKVNLWEIATGRRLYEFDTKPNANVHSLAVSPDGIHFAAISSNSSDDLTVYRFPPEIREPQ